MHSFYSFQHVSDLNCTAVHDNVGSHLVAGVSQSNNVEITILEQRAQANIFVYPITACKNPVIALTRTPSKLSGSSEWRPTATERVRASRRETGCYNW